jgi:hypothetical protein
MYDVEILSEMGYRPFELVGMGKKMDEKIMDITQSGSFIIGKADHGPQRKMKLKDIASSIMRR